MKNIILSITAVALAATILLTCFAACGAENNSVTATSDSAAGVSSGVIEDDVTYKLVSIVQDGKDSSKTIDLMEKSGMNTTFVLNGTRVAMLDDVYTLKDGKIFNDDNSFTYKVESSKLTLDDGKGGVTVFEKQ